MEFVLVSQNALKLRGKNASLIVDPSLVTVKTEADVAVALSKAESSKEKVEGIRLSITGPGDYEVGGIKISAAKSSESFAYTITIDNVEIFLANASSLDKTAEQGNDLDVAVIHADGAQNDGAITALTPKVIILYGNHAKDLAKALGKENPTAVAKYQAVREKLPAEMEVVVLG